MFISPRARTLQIGVTGSAPDDERRNPVHMLGFTDVQRLILEIARQPRPRADLEAVTAGKAFSVEDMAGAGLVREEKDLYWIDFNLLRGADLKMISAAAEAFGRDLARAFLARRREFAALAADHPQPAIGLPALSYLVLGCFSLDWDGLNLTQALGYREGTQCALNGCRFTPWAKEMGGVSLRGLYWGSHSQSGSRFTFTTFGDHQALPRFGLPDMIWNHQNAFACYRTSPNGQRAAQRLFARYSDPAEALDDSAAVMQLLRPCALSEEQLRSRTQLAPERLGRLLDLLEAGDYIERAGQTVRSCTFVLTEAEADLVRALLDIGRGILAAWHEQHYPAIRARLSRLTPLQYGVPFERVYTEVWHFLFGTTSRVLAEAGFFADPYAEKRRFKGFLPAVWANGLDELW